VFVVLWIVLFAIFAGGYGAYFTYLKLNIKKPWKFTIDESFEPGVTVLVPVHNEEQAIRTKLENLAAVEYSRQKMDIFLIDDASTDRTMEIVTQFVREHSDMPIKMITQSPRGGKAQALNKGLKFCSKEIVVVSDADALWPSDILHRALPYLSDQTVGAITGRQIPAGRGQSWVAKAESSYLDFMYFLRLGESKIHSTIRFEGVFCAFKKSAFDEFDHESGSDDSGTALKIVQNKLRAILLPDVSVPSEVPATFIKRVKTKVRRATQLSALWLQCFRLLIEGRLNMPKSIAIPEIFISIFNPFIFVALVAATIILIVRYPIILIPFAIVLILAGVVSKIRSYFVHGVVDQFVLLYSVLLQVKRNRFAVWEK